jgi:Hemagglutinin repeat
VTLQSGGDTTLQGAVVTGPTIKADIGGSDAHRGVAAVLAVLLAAVAGGKEINGQISPDQDVLASQRVAADTAPSPRTRQTRLSIPSSRSA